jgi:hypothetical protein
MSKYYTKQTKFRNNNYLLFNKPSFRINSSLLLFVYLLDDLCEDEDEDDRDDEAFESLRELLLFRCETDTPEPEDDLLLDGATELPELDTDELLEGALPILAVPGFLEGALPILTVPELLEGALPILAVPEFLEGVLPEVVTELLPLYVEVLFAEGVVPCTVLLFI